MQIPKAESSELIEFRNALVPKRRRAYFADNLAALSMNSLRRTAICARK